MTIITTIPIDQIENKILKLCSSVNTLQQSKYTQFTLSIINNFKLKYFMYFESHNILLIDIDEILITIKNAVEIFNLDYLDDLALLIELNNLLMEWRKNLVSCNV